MILWDLATTDMVVAFTNMVPINAVPRYGLFILGTNHCLFFQFSVGASVVSILRGI
jgi:hypothetical protein